MTIPQDHITFDGETAWLVSDDGWIDNYCKMHSLTERGGDLLRLQGLDRPCDTCGGDCEDGPNYHTPIAWHCPDCIDGRHTFDIEVECDCDDWDCPRCNDLDVSTCPVSIVPGMVLPIWAASYADNVHGPHICIQPGGRFTLHTWDGWQDATLPPAAKSGMWAVQLKVTR